MTRTAEQVGIPRIPVSLRWDGAGAGSYVTDDDGFTITAGPQTDLFIDPQRTAATVNAPRLLACGKGDFLLSAHVRVDFSRPRDAGALLVWHSDRAWAKLGLELSAQGEAEIASVVTRGTSDHSSGFVVGGGEVWLRVARVGGAYAFHASVDGTYWRLVRLFSLYASDAPSYGFAAQSPDTEGCAVTFRAISYEQRRLAELHDGS